MNKTKKLPTLAKKVVLAWMVVMMISNVAIGIISFSIYRSRLYEERGEEAMNVATSIAVRIDGDKFNEIMDTLEKNDYWHEIKDYADRVATVFGTAFIYILDNDYTDEVTYFAEGAPDDAPFDLGDTEVIEDIYADEMFVTLRTGEGTITDPYSSGDYGDMVSGFAAIKSSSGSVVGVVGVDFYYNNIQEQLGRFALYLTLVVAGFLIGCYFLMMYLGTKLAGTPLTSLDLAARKLAVGDMDISFNIKSTTEIGRLAASFTRMIENIKVQVEALEALSQGDLTPNIEPRCDNDTMGLAIAKILANLNSMFGEIDQSAAQVSAGARQLSDSAQSLANGAAEQADAVQRLSVSIADVTDKAKANLEIAAKTNRLTTDIKSEAQTGSEHMNKMTSAVKDISDASLSINKVIKVIDDIAFQTNILALNAAVEAARAGQHGKGFAVVAEEVRNLAAKSAEAAKDTEHLISDSMEKAKLGATIADETAGSLARIIQGVNDCAVLVDGIAGSFDEQIDAMLEINKGVEQVSSVVQRNSAAAQQSAAASQEMSNQSELLESLIAGFKLNEEARRRPSSNIPRGPMRLPNSDESAKWQNDKYYGKY